MRVAILGAGFAGLAVTWHLLNQTKGETTVDLFDPLPIGAGASGISSGLLHPFGGKRANKSWRGRRGMRDAHRLITEASKALNQPLVQSHGILRPALSEEQCIDFQQSASEFPQEAEWWEASRCEAFVPGLHVPPGCGGLYIKGGITLDPALYLQGLWQACARLGTQFHQTVEVDVQKLYQYDRVVLAMGAFSKMLEPLKDLPITPIKGQILELEWPQQLPPLPCSLISGKYLVMGKEGKSCHVGATFEREFTSPESDQPKAEADILPTIHAFFPQLEGAKVLSCRAGVRAASPNKLPMVGKAVDHFYFFTALGSKGLLYHSYVGRRMAQALITEDLRYLPSDLTFKLPQPS